MGVSIFGSLRVSASQVQILRREQLRCPRLPLGSTVDFSYRIEGAFYRLPGYAQQQRQTLHKANRKRAAGGRSKAHQIAAYFDDHYFQTGRYPTVAEAATEHGTSRRTVQRALAKAGIDLGSGGRPRKGDTP